MALAGALILFLVFIVVFVAIVEIFTVLFRLTGLTEEKAKFQVISMLTNSGFTTTESELIISSKRRRRLARITIIFGYAFSVVIVSLLVNFFLELSKSEINHLIGIVPIATFLLLLFVILTRSSKLKTALDMRIQSIAGHFISKHSNSVMVMDNYGGRTMATVNMNIVPKILDGIMLGDSGLKHEHGIQVLVLRRGGGLMDIGAQTIFQARDVMVVFGHEKEIRRVFELSVDADKKHRKDHIDPDSDLA